MSYLFKAIKKLKPEAQFSFQNEDYSTVKWDSIEGEAPDEKVIDLTIKQIKLEEADAESAAEALKESLVFKLERLGLDEGDLQALGLLQKD